MTIDSVPQSRLKGGGVKRRLGLLRPRADWVSVLDAIYAPTEDDDRWAHD